MSACWGSEHVRRRVDRRFGVVGLVLAVGCIAWPATHAEARSHRERDRDSARVARKIVVDDRGIEIIHKDEHVVRDERGRVRVTVDSERGDVDVQTSDTLQFRDAGDVHIGPHGVTTDSHPDAGIVRMFSDAEVHEGERVEGDVVAVFGDVQVAGQVSGNVVSVFGSVRMEPGARIDGDAVAVGGGLDQPPGAEVGGESVSLGFLPMHWGAPTLGMLVGGVFLGWLVSLFLGWVLMLLFPRRMVRTAITASRRTGGSLVLGLLSGPLLVIAVVLLLVTVIGIPVALVLPFFYFFSLWAGQLALTYALGCRLTRRRVGDGTLVGPLLAGTLFVASFFVLGSMLGAMDGVIRTVALFFHLLGFLLVTGLSVIGVGAFILSRMGTRPRDLDPRAGAVAAVAMGHPMAPGPEPPPAPLAPPAT